MRTGADQHPRSRPAAYERPLRALRHPARQRRRSSCPDATEERAAGDSWSRSPRIGAIAICTINERTIFTQTLRARGQLVQTPSGNQHLVCHVQPPSRLFVAQPSEAIVVRDFPCAVGNRRTRESQLVVTPSLHVHVVCHITPSG